MFGTRLNPIKPGAAHRAALERAGNACRELQATQEGSGGSPLPYEHVRDTFAKHGLFKIGIAPEFGGATTDPLLTVLAAERLGREGLRYVNFFLLQHAIASSTVTRWGTDEQKRRLLPQAVSGHHALAVSAQAISSVQSDLVIDAESPTDRLLINGRTWGSTSESTGGTLVVVGKHQHEPTYTALLIDTARPGVQVSRRGGDTAPASDLFCEFEFANCEVSESSVLGHKGDGLSILSAARSDARLGIGAGCLGAMEDSLEAIASVASDRLRTGEWAQARQAIERYLAGVATDLEASRGLIYAAAMLQADFDRRPTSQHLASETSTLIREAYYFATQSIHRQHSGAESVRVANRTLLDFMPTRHRINAGSSDLFEEPSQDLERNIAAYYLDSDRDAGSTPSTESKSE